MIVFDLSCENGHAFEGWFGSSDDFSMQQQRGLLLCPQCGTPEVLKAPMAPSVPRKGNQAQLARPTSDTATEVVNEPSAAPMGGDEQSQLVSNAPMPPEVQKALRKLAEVQSKALQKSKWVGKNFADDARAMHYGEADAEAIHGETSVEEAQQLVDEGIDIAPLPFPVAPPEDLN